MNKCFLILMILLILLMTLMAGCIKDESFDLAKVMQTRPAKDKVVFDYVGLMQDVEESTSGYLENIRNRYQIEILMVALPGLGELYTVNQTAAELFSNWKIGKDFHGRGVLLLLVNGAKEVKLEVSYELEDVFTDMFTGRIEKVTKREPWQRRSMRQRGNS